MSWRACPLRLRWCWPGLLRLRARHPRAAPALLLALFGSGCRCMWRRSCFSSCNRSLSCRPSRPTAASDGWPDLLRGVGVAVHPEQGQVSKPLVLMVSLSLAAWPSCTTGPWRSSWSASPAAAQPCPSPSSGAARRPSSSTAELWAGNSTGTGRSVRRPSAPRTAPSKAPRLQGRWRSRDIAIAVGAASFKSGPAANYYNHFKNYRKTDRAEHLDLLHCIFGPTSRRSPSSLRPRGARPHGPGHRGADRAVPLPPRQLCAHPLREQPRWMSRPWSRPPLRGGLPRRRQRCGAITVQRSMEECLRSAKRKAAVQDKRMHGFYRSRNSNSNSRSKQAPARERWSGGAGGEISLFADAAMESSLSQPAQPSRWGAPVRVQADLRGRRGVLLPG